MSRETLYQEYEVTTLASFTQIGKTWQYSVSHTVRGKYKPIRKGGFRTKKEAQLAAAEVELNLQKGILPILRRIPFSEYFEQWLEDFKTDIGEITLNRYKDTLGSIRDHFKDDYIQDIDKRQYQRFMNEYGKTHAKSTARKLNSHIRACVKDAIDEGVIQVDFTRKVVITGKPSKKSEDKHLSYMESKRLLKLLHSRLDRSLGYYLLLLGLTTGMRFGEMVGLTRKDFDFKNNKINIDKTWDYKKGTGFGPTKDSSDRVIDVNEKTMNVFKELFKKMPDNIHGLVFFSSISKYKVLTNEGMNKLLRTVLKELGINSITVHGLRHTHISVLLYRKVSIYYAAERAGHASTETTTETYAHVIKELRDEDAKLSIKIFEDMAV